MTEGILTAYLSASLLLLGIGLWIWQVWQRYIQTRYLFFLATLFFLLALAIISIVAVWQTPTLWPYLAALGTVSTVIPQKYPRLPYVALLFTGLMLLPLSLIFASTIQESRQEYLATQAEDQVMNDIQNKISLANQEVQRLAAVKNLDTNSLRQAMISDNLQVAILTDDQGTVIAQPSQSNLTKYPLTAEFPWFGSGGSGLAVPLDGVPVAVASNTHLLLGYRLDSTFLRQESSHGYVALSDSQGNLVSNTVGIEGAVCQAFLKQRPPRSDGTEIRTGMVNGKRYLFLTKPLNLQGTNQPDYLLLLRHV